MLKKQGISGQAQIISDTGLADPLSARQINISKSRSFLILHGFWPSDWYKRVV